MPPPVSLVTQRKIDLLAEAELELELTSKFDAELDRYAQSFIDTDPELKKLTDILVENPDQFIRVTANSFNKSTRKQHLKALAFVYTLWIRSGKNNAFKIYINRLRDMQKRPNKRTTALHLIARHLIRYGEEADGKSLSEHRGLHNRDVNAILYLHNQRFGPDRIEELGEDEGEGLDTWSRKWTAIKRHANGASAPTPVPISREISISVRSIDASGKAYRENFTIVDNDVTRGLIGQLLEQRIDIA